MIYIYICVHGNFYIHMYIFCTYVCMCILKLPHNQLFIDFFCCQATHMYIHLHYMQPCTYIHNHALVSTPHAFEIDMLPTHPLPGELTNVCRSVVVCPFCCGSLGCGVRKGAKLYFQHKQVKEFI